MKMNWDKVKDVIGSVAPTVGAALGGPLGGVAGKIIRDALGVDSDKAAIEALQVDPQAVLKLKTAEIEFDKFVIASEIDLAELGAADRQNARTAAKTVNFWPQVVLSSLFVAGYFIIFLLMMTGKITPVDGFKDMVLILLGVLGAEVTRIMAFWFGSSMGSKEKTAKL